MEQDVWMLEMTHLDSGDTTVRLVAESVDLTEWITAFFADPDSDSDMTLEEVSYRSHCSSVREWTLQGSEDARDDYDIVATLMPIERSI